MGRVRVGPWPLSANVFGYSLQEIAIMTLRSTAIAALGLIVCLASQRTHAETLEGLARRIPGDVNAIVLIDVEQVLATKLAQTQGWARKLETAYVERPIFLPPEAKKLVLGAVLDPTDDFLATRELAVMELSEPVGIRALARAESGYVDEINGKSAAITPADAAFIDLGGNILATVRPADRQYLARWIDFADDRASVRLSDYLQKSLPLVTDRVQVLLAIDLKDILGPHDIEAKVGANALIQTKHADAAEIAKVLGTLRGAALRLAIDDDCQGQLQVDFDADVAPLGDLAKPLVLGALENLGLATDELATWKVSLAEKSIRMNGPLSADGQRRVFSVIELPAPKLDATDAATAAGDPAAANDSETRERSLAYFKSTEVLTADLRKGLKDTKATSAWLERYAKRVDDLPVLHVDEQLLDYGDKLAETFRVMSLSKRQAGIRAGVRATEGSYAGFYDYNGYYNFGSTAYSSAADRRQAEKEEMSVASDTRVQGWKLIDDATADIRRSLTKKYGVEF
jgi:hypothetical protein